MKNRSVGFLAFIALLFFISFSFIKNQEEDLFILPNISIDSLHKSSIYTLKVQILKRDNSGEWSKGYTDYHAKCRVTKDYKGNYNDNNVYFHHRVDGNDKEEILHKQLSIGKEYIVFLDSLHTTISDGVFEHGKLVIIEQKVYVLLENYKGVLPFTVKNEELLK